MMAGPAISVVGAGLIGRRHVAAIKAAASVATLHSIVDPTPQAKTLAAEIGVAWFRTLDDMLSGEMPDGVILATPNQFHGDGALRCIEAGLPALVEKPLATDVATGLTMIEAAGAAGVPLLTGHHRRHNPLIRRAKAEIEDGGIGRIVSIHASFWIFKPDDYFDTEWRRMPGAGPVFVNLIHDIDLLRYLCGPIETVFAQKSNMVRGHPVEDTAVITLKFASGALGTINVSDTIVAPWSWEMTARENPAYPPTPEACCLIGGTHGSLELPGLRLWRHTDKRSWWEPIGASQLTYGFDDPLVLQIHNFASVIAGEGKPLVSGRDGLAALCVIDAVGRSAAEGRPISVAGDSEGTLQ